MAHSTVANPNITHKRTGEARHTLVLNLLHISLNIRRQASPGRGEGPRGVILGVSSMQISNLALYDGVTLGANFSFNFGPKEHLDQIRITPSVSSQRKETTLGLSQSEDPHPSADTKSEKNGFLPRLRQASVSQPRGRVVSCHLPSSQPPVG